MRLFRRNILRDLPAPCEIIEKDGERLAQFEDGKVRVRPIVTVRRKGRPPVDRICVGTTRHWFGKVQLGPKAWRTVRLFTDKTASERELQKLQAQADQRAAGIATPATDKLRQPITTLRDEYLAALERQRHKPDHVRITRFMLDRLIELGEWRYFSDITVPSVEKITKRVADEGRTVSYQNKFIARAKAFVNHFLPDGYANPLAKLRRIREKGAKRTRGRRAASAEQIIAQLESDVPADRQLCYALAALNGLRRNEIGSLLWEHVHLHSPIPHLGLLNKQRGDDTLDYVPIHPYVAYLLRQRTAAMPGVRLVRSVPDVATLEKDWSRVGVTMIDERGLRLDFHALRHTFQTHLDQTGCSRATKKRLMRHAAEDVTDGYAHAELAEMLVALVRLHAPKVAPAALKTGTDAGDALPNQAAARTTGRTMGWGPSGPRAVSTDEHTRALRDGMAPDARRDSPRKTRAKSDERRSETTTDLSGIAGAAIVPKMRPSTQVD
jgi:integrase